MCFCVCPGINIHIHPAARGNKNIKQVVALHFGNLLLLNKLSKHHLICRVKNLPYSFAQNTLIPRDQFNRQNGEDQFQKAKCMHLPKLSLLWLISAVTLDKELG